MSQDHEYRFWQERRFDELIKRLVNGLPHWTNKQLDDFMEDLLERLDRDEL